MSDILESIRNPKPRRRLQLPAAKKIFKTVGLLCCLGVGVYHFDAGDNVMGMLWFLMGFVVFGDR